MNISSKVGETSMKGLLLMNCFNSQKRIYIYLYFRVFIFYKFLFISTKNIETNAIISDDCS